MWNEEGLLLLPKTTVKRINTAAIAEIKEDAKGIHIKLHSKLKAIELLQKYHNEDCNTIHEDDELPPALQLLLK